MKILLSIILSISIFSNVFFIWKYHDICMAKDYFVQSYNQANGRIWKLEYCLKKLHPEIDTKSCSFYDRDYRNYPNL